MPRPASSARPLLAAALAASALGLAATAAPAGAATTCGYTPFTASTSIFVKKSGSITCTTAKIKVRSYLKTGRAPQGWRCTDNRTDYYLCVRKNGSGRAYGRLDTTSGD